MGALRQNEFLQQRLNEMRGELDTLTLKNEETTKLCASQQQTICSLEDQIVSLEQTRKTQTDMKCKLQNKTDENMKLMMELNDLNKENAKNKNILQDFGKLQHNLSEYKTNEKVLRAKMQQLELKNGSLRGQVERLQTIETTPGGQFVSFRDDVRSYNAMQHNGFGHNYYKSLAVVFGLSCLCFCL